jgi:hypothetical protein
MGQKSEPLKGPAPSFVYELVSGVRLAAAETVVATDFAAADGALAQFRRDEFGIGIPGLRDVDRRDARRMRRTLSGHAAASCLTT